MSVRNVCGIKRIGSEIQFLQAKTNYEAQKNAVAQLEKNWLN